jgi:actin-related protein
VVARGLARMQVALPANRERECIRIVKEHSECVLSQESDRLEPKSLMLPDGQAVTLGATDQLACAEALFYPRAQGFERQGLHELVVQSVGRVELDHKKDLLGSIVLSGGTSVIPGLGARLEAEIEAISQNLSNIKKVVI